MVERIRITPTSLVTKNSAGQISFSTDNLYLKSAPTGNIKAGGYSRCPVIFGQGASVSDTTNLGGFPLKVMPTNTAYGAFSILMPNLAINTINLHKQNINLPAIVTFSSPCTITSGGVSVGSFRYAHLLLFDGDPQNVVASLWDISELSMPTSFSGGVLTFGVAPDGKFYRKDSSGNYVYSSTSTTALPSADCIGLVFSCTSTAATLALGVTP